jgi:hypothetical protein
VLTPEAAPNSNTLMLNTLNTTTLVGLLGARIDPCLHMYETLQPSTSSFWWIIHDIGFQGRIPAPVTMVILPDPTDTEDGVTGMLDL